MVSDPVEDRDEAGLDTFTPRPAVSAKRSVKNRLREYLYVHGPYHGNITWATGLGNPRPRGRSAGLPVIIFRTDLRQESSRRTHRKGGSHSQAGAIHGT